MTTIAHTLLKKQTALAQVDRIEAGILELETFPYRCPERTTGIYAHQGYRQLLVDNYTAVYRVDESKKQVIIRHYPLLQKSILNITPQSIFTKYSVGVLLSLL